MLQVLNHNARLARSPHCSSQLEIFSGDNLIVPAAVKMSLQSRTHWRLGLSGLDFSEFSNLSEVRYLNDDSLLVAADKGVMQTPQGFRAWFKAEPMEVDGDISYLRLDVRAGQKGRWFAEQHWKKHLPLISEMPLLLDQAIVPASAANSILLPVFEESLSQWIMEDMKIRGVVLSAIEFSGDSPEWIGPAGHGYAHGIFASYRRPPAVGTTIGLHYLLKLRRRTWRDYHIVVEATRTARGWEVLEDCLGRE
ncbi:MAG: hypothetical protein PHC51_07930 [bacterium]|nr:hypothetical protein [bacterium]